MTTSAFGVDHGYEEISKIGLGSVGGMLKPVKAFASGAKSGFGGGKGGIPMSTSFNRGAKFGGGTAGRLKAIGADTGQLTSRMGATKLGTKMQANPLKTGGAVAAGGTAAVGGTGYALGRRKG